MAMFAGLDVGFKREVCWRLMSVPGVGGAGVHGG